MENLSQGTVFKSSDGVKNEYRSMMRHTDSGFLSRTRKTRLIPADAFKGWGIPIALANHSLDSTLHYREEGLAD